MKKILNLIYIPLLAIGLSGCEDFLTVSAPDQSTSENYWKSEVDALSGLSAAYSQLYYGGEWQFHEYQFVFETFREDIIKLGADALHYPEMVEVADFTFNMNSSKPAGVWSFNYWGLSYSNQVIDKVTQMDDKLFTGNNKAQILAEARFMRAYYHMVLLMNWEQIIVRDKYITSESDIDKALSSRTDAWDYIVQDLNYAAGALPPVRDDASKGRVTSAAANAYLGYALLTMAYEQPAKKAEHLTAAATALKKENFSDYELIPMKDWLGMFNGDNQNSKEAVFEIQYSENISGGAYYRHASHYWIASVELGGWEGPLPADQLVSEFKKEGKIAQTGNYDSRLYSTMWFQDPYFNDGTGKVWGKEYDDVFCEFEKEVPGAAFKDGVKKPGTAYNKPVFRKFIPSKWAGMGTQQTSMNVVLMRYANVLLMLAEVYNEQNHPELAIPLINEVRNRANMPDMSGTTPEAVRAQIEHERTVEFALENFRFYDLRRWGKTKQALHAVGRTGFDPAKHNFFYLPEEELNSNGEMK